VIGVRDAAEEIGEGGDAARLLGRDVRQGVLERVERLDAFGGVIDVDLEAELPQDGGQHARSIKPIGHEPAGLRRGADPVP
jgi:hypothetical protein